MFYILKQSPLINSRSNCYFSNQQRNLYDKRNWYGFTTRYSSGSFRQITYHKNIQLWTIRINEDIGNQIINRKHKTFSISTSLIRINRVSDKFEILCSVSYPSLDVSKHKRKVLNNKRINWGRKRIVLRC